MRDDQLQLFERSAQELRGLMRNVLVGGPMESVATNAVLLRDLAVDGVGVRLFREI